MPLEKLRDLGVLYWKLDADNHVTDPKLAAIRKARGYSYQVKLLLCSSLLQIHSLGSQAYWATNAYQKP